MNEQILKVNETCTYACDTKCTAWTGILAGALTAVGLTFLLSLFGAAIGLAAFKTTADGTTLAVGGYIGTLIGVIAVMFFAGWVAGFFGSKHCFNRNLGALYGFLAWCVALVVLVLISTQSMQFVSARLYAITDRNLTTAKVFYDNSYQMVIEPSSANTTNVSVAPATTRDAATADLMSKALFLTFIMFFIGAISSAIGGYCGTRSNEVCRTDRPDTAKPWQEGRP